MGTRGLFGFHYKGKFYVAYNHFDSYPDGLGNDIIKEIKKAISNGTFESWKLKLENIKCIDEETPPTTEDIQKLKPYTDLNVSTASTSDWYCLLRKCQGSLELILESGYLNNHVKKDGKPYFQEFAYIVNFDTQKLDFYCGSKLSKEFDIYNLEYF